MKGFEYARPRTVSEAVALLEEYGPDARLLAGGTDLLIRFRDGSIRPRLVIDLKQIAELRPAIRVEDGYLSISASTVMTDIVEDGLVQRHFRALAEAAVVVGSVQIRNRATLAGNICNASPAADTVPPLLVYGAGVKLISASGDRTVLLEDFLVGPGRTSLRRGEIVASVDLPIPGSRVGAAFGRVTRRRGTDLATINLSCLVTEQGVTRFAFGAVGPKAILAVDETGLLADPHADEEARRRVLEDLIADTSPITDVRASRQYRRAMLLVVGWRTLERAVERLGRDSDDGS